MGNKEINMKREKKLTRKKNAEMSSEELSAVRFLTKPYPYVIFSILQRIHRVNTTFNLAKYQDVYFCLQI